MEQSRPLLVLALVLVLVLLRKAGELECASHQTTDVAAGGEGGIGGGDDGHGDK